MRGCSEAWYGWRSISCFCACAVVLVCLLSVVIVCCDAALGKMEVRALSSLLVGILSFLIGSNLSLPFYGGKPKLHYFIMNIKLNEKMRHDTTVGVGVGITLQNRPLQALDHGGPRQQQQP